VTGFAGTIWGDNWAPTDLPADLAPGGVNHRSAGYERLSYASLGMGMRSVTGDTWQLLAVRDQARSSLAQVLSGNEAVDFGVPSERAFAGPEGWCGLFHADDNPACSVYPLGGTVDAGYNKASLRLGVVASTGTRSCWGPNPIYLGFGGAVANAPVGLRSTDWIHRSNCHPYNYDHRAHGQIWVR
jgi:hypothetical protein